MSSLPNRIQYTGTNYAQVREFCGEDKILAPYFCMGFTILSLLTEEGYITVNEGDYIIKHGDGHFEVV